ncbi:MAG: helix-turn-helix domain-containing protein [Verrucomicrobiota bacterium]|nr:helix-turn-helix domain-containing protein [Verrucomicrobiota bacterium]
MEGLGEKFQKARQARNLTLEEAARMTKIRPTKLAEIEAEDFSQFPSLAYAKGFILIYGKFLNVDVSPYLEAFETSEHVTVDGYSYLQDNPAPAPRRTELVRKAPPGDRSSLAPLLIGIVVLVAGFWFLKFMLDVRRLQPSGARDREALAQAASPSPAISGNIIAPRALPADSTPAPNPTPVLLAKAVPTPPPSIPERTQTIATALPPGPEGEPEVRRAEPVNAKDLKAAALAQAASPSPAVNRFELRPLRKTYVRVTVDGGGKPVERWVNASEGLTFRGKRIAVKVLDPRDVEIRKNGKVVGRGDSDVRME